MARVEANIESNMQTVLNDWGCIRREGEAVGGEARTHGRQLKQTTQNLVGSQKHGAKLSRRGSISKTDKKQWSMQGAIRPYFYVRDKYWYSMTYYYS